MKLEFGNLEHIKMRKEAEREADLKTFIVDMEWTGSQSVEVRALNKEEAKELADQKFDPFNVDEVTYEVRLKK